MEYLIKTVSIGGLTEEQFFHFCQENDSLRLERTSDGEIVILEPTYTYTGWFNMNIGTELSLWNRQTQRGLVFDSNTGFTLPNKAVRSPDAAFIANEIWNKITEEDRWKFAHVCPDFIVEILSESDREFTLRNKMKEWMDNGCRLAWMINPHKEETTIYRENGMQEIRTFDEILDGDEVLPGFKLYLRPLFTGQPPPLPHQ